MNQPNPGWYQQPYQPQQPVHGYPQQQPPPGYGYPPGYGPPRPSTAMAYVAAAFFLPAIAFTYIVAVISWDGTTDNLDALVATLGLAFTDDLTGNVDFAITFSISFASTVTLFAVLLCFRLGFVRWILVALAAIGSGYYVYAIIDLLSSTGGGDYVGMPVVALLLWLVPLVGAALPATGRAMRGAGQRPLVAHGHWR
ncbi:hypothetical protein [Prauserella cavernicola]|uniref:Uncharacterized protein n=1 Tax=Prauserella cavernicola TaxID=2800127 RepID=A0A934QR16_9PSEU|nr:hypothetical protein [Prauserella cavernicola]MBK1784800.1 hypothetical protein [Prauserella cavernicola]